MPSRFRSAAFGHCSIVDQRSLTSAPICGANQKVRLSTETFLISLKSILVSRSPVQQESFPIGVSTSSVPSTVNLHLTVKPSSYFASVVNVVVRDQFPGQNNTGAANLRKAPFSPSVSPWITMYPVNFNQAASKGLIKPNHLDNHLTTKGQKKGQSWVGADFCAEGHSSLFHSVSSCSAPLPLSVCCYRVAGSALVG